MRSNDAFIGLPGDIFAFTMLQENVAKCLNVELGRYKHLVGSLHLYEKNRKQALLYVAEGFQRKVMMPIMPTGDPLQNIAILLRFERGLRLGKHPKMPTNLLPYWEDFATLLAVFRASKDKASPSVIRSIRRKLHSDAYRPYIEMRVKRAEENEVKAPAQSQELPFREGIDA